MPIDRLSRATPTAPPAHRRERAAARTPQASATALATAIGNRAMARLLARQPTTAQRQQQRLPIPSFEVTRAEVEAAEAWVLWIAQRQIPARPTAPLPDRYETALDTLNAAVWGASGDGKHKPADDARWFLRDLRAQHDRLMKGQDTKVFDLAELALQRGAINAAHSEGELAFDARGATQLDVGRALLYVENHADEEVAAAKEMGYTIPEDLANLGAAAQARYDRASKTWNRGAPGPDTLITPAEEAELVKFRDAGLAIIGSMHARRAADLARYHRAEAEALEAATERHMADLRAILADRRRALFMAGQKGELDKLHDATGDVVDVVNEMKGAARLITQRVDQLNAIAENITKSGKKLVNLPEIPKGLTDAYSKVKSAHEKLGKIIDLLGIVGPGKTQLDDGLRYLKGMDMALEHFSDKLSKGNPFLNVYINAYLRPGIKNCIDQLGKIAGIISSENRSIIESGDPKLLIAINWAVEPGGEHMYLFLAQVFKVGAAAQIDGPGWDYLQDHAGDVEAAVGEALPGEMRALGAWAARNRYPLWETFYGSTRPPR